MAIATVIVLAACTGGVPSVAPSSPTMTARSSAASGPTDASRPSTPRASAAPVASAIGACSQLTGSAAFEDASRGAMDELILAIGNPDVDSESEASAALDQALAAGDPARIATAASVVLDHLARSRDALAGFAECRSSVVGLAEWEALVTGLEAGYGAMRKGGMDGSPTDVEAGRARTVDALQDHFWQAVHGKVLEEATMRWPDGRTIRASRARFGQPVTNAFDGLSDSMWSAGDAAAPQWIEVDFGRAVSIAWIRLLTAQDAPGSTDHEVTVRTPGGESSPFTRFTGQTTDSQWLDHNVSDDPVSNVQVIRVTTVASDSTIGWREVEIHLAFESLQRSCASGTKDLARGRPVMASASLPGNPAELAVDGKPGTAWKAGVAAPQRIEVDLGADVAISQIRLLAAGVSGEATVHVVNARDEAGHTMNLAVLNGATADGQWLTVAGPTPCVGLRWVSVETGASTGPVAWSEIEVLGAAKP